MKSERKDWVPSVFKICICALIGILIFTALPINGEEEIYEKLVRLHVIANSDSENDQSLKLKVRDSVISDIGSEISEFQSAEEAEAWLNANRNRIERSALEAIEREGYDYPVTVKLGQEIYPRRVYENVTLPAGEYYSVRVCIGEAEGKNWWCVLFPPLCRNVAMPEADAETFAGVSGMLKNAGLGEEPIQLITEPQKPKYVLKFRVLEIIDSWIHGFHKN